MKRVSVGFLGCGNIGCGVYRLLAEHGAAMAENEGVEFDVRKVLVRSLAKKRAIDVPNEMLTDRAADVLDNPEIDVVMEFMGGVEPAASYMIQALRSAASETNAQTTGTGGTTNA